MRDMGFWILFLVLTTRGGPVRLRFIVTVMLIMAGILLLIRLIIGGPRPLPWSYITLPVLLFGVVQYFGSRVRCNLRLWYPQKVKRFERFEDWAVWAFLIYYGAHLIFSGS